MTTRERSENARRDGQTFDLDSIGWPENAPALSYLRTLAPGSRHTQWSSIRVLGKILSNGVIEDGRFPWEEITPEAVARLRETLIDRYAPATGRRHLSTFRAVIEFTYIAGLIDVDRRDRLIHPRHLAPIRGSSPPAGRALDVLEVSRLLDVCYQDDRPIGVRDSAIVSVLYCGGIRGRELINLDVGDVKLRTGETRIHGKGRKQRDIVLASSAVDTIRDWLKIRGREAGPLFVPFDNAGKPILDLRLTYTGVSHALHRRAELAGLDDWKTHDLRRTFVTELLESGARLDIVSHACGHSDPKTTARYSRRKEKESERMTRGRELPRIKERRKK